MKNIEENIILTNFDIEKKIERISLQILESNSEEKKIIFFGISDNGILIAKKIINLINGPQRYCLLKRCYVISCVTLRYKHEILHDKSLKM